MVELFSEKTEKALLGLLILKPSLLKRIIGSIQPTDFYNKKNQLVFQAILNSFKKHNSSDEVLVIEELSILIPGSKDDIFSYVAELISYSGIETNIDKYVNIIKEKQQTRALESTLKESIDIVSTSGTSVSELIGQVESKIFNVTKNRELKDFKNINSLTEEYQIKMKRMNEEGYQEGLRTKIASLDEKIGGLKDGEFIIVAARPSMGKTAFALEISKNISFSKNVGLFSLEMPAEQLIKRMVSSESMIDQRDFNKMSQMSQMSKARLVSGFEKIGKLNLWIDDSATLKIGELSWKARKLNDLHNLDLIVIDYLQLIESENRLGDNRQQAISDISRQLKALARELEIPIIALSQLSRRVEQREDKRPQMSDIRESGAIEQDADIIMFLYREDYYKHDNNSLKKPMSDLEVIISKHRNGPTGIVRLGLDLTYGKISSMNSMYNKKGS